MNFDLPVETFVRLANVCKFQPNYVSSDERENLKCVRLEIKDGKKFAVATNRKIAAIYFLGNTQEPDGVVHINVEPVLLKQCETEIPFNSVLFINTIPEIQVISLKTTLGYNFAGASVGYFENRTKIHDWRSWKPTKEIQSSNGAMFWEVDQIETLARSSPSGYIVFPEFIDVSQPVIVRDIADQSWVGVFMGNKLDDKDGKAFSPEPATIPKWW